MKKLLLVCFAVLCVILNGVPTEARTATPKTAFVHFIGLCMFIAGNPGVHAVLPTIEQSAHATHRPVAGSTTPVEAHAPIIAFPDCALQHSDWPIEDLTPAGNYNFIRLDGAHVEIVANGPNDVAKIPAGLPPLSHGCASQMPTERTTATRADWYPPPLKPGYRPPDYPAAAAVVKVSKGKLTACRAKVQGHTLSRVDTRAEVVNDGLITIQTTKGPLKKLILAGDARIIVGHLPEWVLGSTNSSGGSDAGHFAVYYSMLADARGCERALATAGTICEVEVVAPKTKGNPYPFPEGIAARVTAECSNTTYP